MTRDEHFVIGLVTVAAVVAAALVVYLLVIRVLYRVGMRSETAQQLRERVRWPARALVVSLATLLSLPVIGLRDALLAPAEHALGLVLIAVSAWLLLRGIGVAQDAAMRRFTIEMKDNLHARSKRTQATVLARVASVTVVVLAMAAILLTFEGARTVGASLLASAGVAGLIAGVAARSTLGNLVAGVQIAFTEPIRLDDVVVVEGEWGRIEELTLTYVVVRIWDNRRLVLPTTYFVEQPFQNWTRSNAQVLGAVNLHLDYTTPVDDVRAELKRVLDTSDKWDGDAWVLQVIAATEHTIEVRALMSAEDAPTSWDLRCEVREQLVRFLQEDHPRSLPRLRLEEAEDARATDGHRFRRPGAGQDISELDDLRPEAGWGDDYSPSAAGESNDVQ